MNKESSFTSADSLPIKLFYHEGTVKFRPLHVQWLPTNACNLDCPLCSCANRDKGQKMDIETAVKVIGNLAELGCRATTITGGGEPMMHPQLDQMIYAFARNGIKVGLVSNGLLLNHLPHYALGKITWCRISSMDGRPFTDRYRDTLHDVVAAPVDWAFSHVVTATPDLETISRVVDFANAHNFTHVRLVANLLDVGNVDPDFKTVKKLLQGRDDRVIYQSRQQPVPCRKCMIGYVKPLVAPDFQVYLCCGVQYALMEKSLSLPEELCMGSATELEKIYAEIKPYDVPCAACYYTQYNDILMRLFDSPCHKEFV